MSYLHWDHTLISIPFTHYSTMSECSMKCTTPHHTIPYHTIKYNTIRYHTTLYHTMHTPYHVLNRLNSTVVQYMLCDGIYMIAHHELHHSRQVPLHVIPIQSVAHHTNHTMQNPPIPHHVLSSFTVVFISSVSVCLEELQISFLCPL